MKKFKFLALTALFGAMSTNAFAAEETVTDEAARSVNGIVYKLETVKDGKTIKSRMATVVGVNASATAAQKETIEIRKEVTGDNGETYKVVAINTDWENAATYADVTADCKSLTINTDNLSVNLAADAFNDFTKLETLVIADSNKDTKTTAFPAGLTNSKATIASVTLSSYIKTIQSSAFFNCVKITSFDLKNIEGIEADAFNGTMISSLTIPATVKQIGDDAFANMYAAETEKEPAKGLQTLVFNANSTDDGFLEIPAAFSGDKLLSSITITSTKATSIAANAFNEASALETLDLSGCTKLATIGSNGFAASEAFKTVKLAGTDLANLDAFDFSKSQKTLEEVTLPAKITTVGTKFKNCVALKEIDLSGTQVKTIAANAFEIDGSVTDKKGKAIDPVLATVKLNAETTKIGESAFAGQKALATIENLNNEKMATIGEKAFRYTALTEVDLSATKLEEIAILAFADMPTLEKVVLPTSINSVRGGAFAHDVKLSSINLENTKITELKIIFSAGANDEAAPCDALKSLTLPKTLTNINSYALQFTGLEEIEIPSTVTTFGTNVLQGCINLKKFTWNDVNNTIILEGQKTFLGCDKLEEVYFVTTGAWPNISDNDFLGNDPERLTVYVNQETYDQLVANGWTPENTKYATLSGEGKTEFSFSDKGKASDGYYYSAYVINGQATWFDAEQIEVFGAVVSGSKVILKPATVENGYYKVGTVEEAVVIRSKTQDVKIEKKNAAFNDINTVGDNQLIVAPAGGTKASRLKYQYKLGAKDGQVKFWRVTSGTIKEGVAYLESDGSKAREFLDIVIDGETTAINFVEAAEEANDGAIYNMQGVRVNNAQKGIYIKNGKKFIVK